MDFMVKIRIFRLLEPGEFTVYRDSEVREMVSTKLLGYLNFRERADFPCLLARLLWGYDGEKDYAAIKEVFKAAMLCCEAKLKEEQNAAIELQKTRPNESWSERYISGSGGRAREPVKEINADILPPFDALWNMTIDVAEKIADPRLYWRIYIDGHRKHVPLTFSRRHWALDLFLGLAKLHKKISDEHDSKKSAMLFQVRNFESLGAKYSLANIYEHLEEWSRLKIHLIEVLDCGNILRFCTDITPRPWEDEQAANRGQPAKLAPGSVDLFPGQPGNVSAEGFAQSYKPNLGDQAARIEARLCTAALRFSSKTRKLGKHQSLTPLVIPFHCSCIREDRADVAIAIFIRLAERDVTLAPEEGPGFWQQLEAQLSVLRQMPEGDPKYLGRLELIYKVAQLMTGVVPHVERTQPRTNQLPHGSGKSVISLGADWWNDTDENDGEEENVQKGVFREDADDLDWEW